MSRLHEALRRAAEERERASAVESPARDHGPEAHDNDAFAQKHSPEAAIRTELQLEYPKARFSAALELPQGLSLPRKSMHIYWLAGSLLIAVIAAGAAHFNRSRVGGLLSAGKLANVAFEGTMQPETEFSVAALGSGTVRTISVQVGDSVHERQVLATLEDQEARLALKEAPGYKRFDPDK